MQFGAFFMFLLRLIFLEFPLSSAKVAGVTGGARIFLFFFYFPDLYRILGKVKVNRQCRKNQQGGTLVVSL